MALRGAFGGRRPALIPPSAPVSEDVLQWWAEPLGIKPHVLQQWQAGMATVTHPVTHEQVEVLALPYYRAGKLVDVRYLHIAADGQPLGSWLAAEACAPYMLEQQFSTTAAAAAQQQPEQQQPLQPQQGVVEGPRDVVFVSSELDALLLHSIDDTWPVIALTPQRPQWHPSIAAQQQQQQQLRPEDPRLCLTGLQADICKRQQQYELGLQQQHLGRIATTAAAGGDSSSEGLTVSAGVSADASISGLQLLLQLPPSAKDCLAVIALQQSPGGEGATLLQDSLAELLGGVMCRQPLWPSSYGSPAECLMTKRAEAAAAKAAAEAASAGADADAADAAAARAAAAAADAAEVETVCTALQGLAGAHALSGWSLLSLHALRDFVCSGSRDGNPDAVVPDALLNAVLWPITGLERFADYAAEVLEYWDVSNMDQLVHSTGWESLDQYYKVCPGEVTLVTGVPNSGKSEWLDALIVHLAESQGWRFAVCSMEKKPRDHARQLLEKHARKPLLQAAYAEGVQRMSVQELEREFAWLCDHFYVIAAGEDKMPTIDWVLEKARAAVIQYGISGLVIDPYNELDPSRPQHIKEHEHVNQTMAVLRKFARDNKVAVWLVAHPRQFAAQWSGQRPGLQDISGGANFANKADNGIVVHRDWARLKEMQDRAAAAAGAAGRGGGSGKQQQQTQQGAAAGASNSRRRSRRASSGEAQAEEGGDGDEQQQQEGQQRDLTEFEVQIYIEKVRNKTTGSRGECVLYYDRVTGRYKDPRSAEMNPEEEGGDGQQPSQPHPSQQPSQVRAYSSSAAATHNGDSGSIMPVLDGTLSVVAEGEAEAQSAEWDAQQEAAERLAKRAELGRSRGGDEDEEAYLQRQQEASEH